MDELYYFVNLIYVGGAIVAVITGAIVTLAVKITRMKDNLAKNTSDIETMKQQKHEERIHQLENHKDAIIDYRRETIDKINLIFRGVYAILADDEESKRSAKKEFDEAKKL